MSEPDWAKIADDYYSQEPSNGDHGTCAICGKSIQFFQTYAYGSTPTDAYWVHDAWDIEKDGPIDHVAELGGPA